MDPLTISAASGLRARMESLNLLANNLANSETGGYKSDREFYSLFVAPEATDPSTGPLDPTTVPVVEKNWTDFSQGTVRLTGNPTDLALQGKGFFAVNAPSGTLYTRNGAFRVSSAGVLTNSDGYTVRAVTTGKPIAVDPALPITIAADGTVTQAGQPVAKLEVVDFDKPETLSKQGGNYFRAPNTTDPALLPRASTTTEVQQGKLESSNVGTAESTVRLVNIMRQFEMLQHAVTIAADMNKQATQEVARVGS
jgi:flagellar basal-body rod protein FlgF